MTKETAIIEQTIYETVVNQLPFGLWCADFSTNTIKGFKCFCELLNTDMSEIPFDSFENLVRSDFRKITPVNFDRMKSGTLLDVTFPTDKRWLKIKETHRDGDGCRVYGYLVECVYESRDKSNVLLETITHHFNRQSSLLAKIFANIDDISAQSLTSAIIDEVMKNVAADRISILQYDENMTTMSCTHEATCQGVPARFNLFRNIPVNNAKWIIDRVSDGSPIVAPLLNNTEHEKRISLDALSCKTDKSVYIFPLIKSGKTYGLMIVDFIRNYADPLKYDEIWFRCVARLIDHSLSLAQKDADHNKNQGLLEGLIKNSPYGFLHLKFIFDGNGAPEDLLILNSNPRIQKWIGKNNINGKQLSSLIDAEAIHILNICSNIAKIGKRQIVEDFLHLDTDNYCADISMPVDNEFICIVSTDSHFFLLPDVKHNVWSSEMSAIQIYNDTSFHNLQHHIRTHMNSILGFAELICSEADMDTKVKYMNIIKDNAQTLMDPSLINNNEECTEQVQNHLSQKTNDGKPKILVAEDTESNFMLVSYILKNEYELIWARDGVEAIELYKSEQPDLILMDVRMPRLGGLAATENIREVDKSIPIIALTAFAFESDKAKTIDAGCTDFIAKPINAASLRNIVYRYIN